MTVRNARAMFSGSPQMDSRFRHRDDRYLFVSLILSLLFHAAVVGLLLHLRPPQIHFFMLVDPGDLAMEMDVGSNFQSSASGASAEIPERRALPEHEREPARRPAESHSDEAAPDELPFEHAWERTAFEERLPPLQRPPVATSRPSEMPESPELDLPIPLDMAKPHADEPSAEPRPDLPLRSAGASGLFPAGRVSSPHRHEAEPAHPADDGAPAQKREETPTRRRLTRPPTHPYHEFIDEPETHLPEPPDRTSQSAHVPSMESEALRLGGDHRSRGVRQRAQVVGTLVPEYPYLSRQRGEEGVVVVSADIGADGRLRSASVDHSSGFPALDAAAVDALRRALFSPASLDGVPVAIRERFAIEFVLDE